MLHVARLYLTSLILVGLLAASGGAQTPATEPVVSAEPTAFATVTSKLDPGGSLYAYLSTDQFLGQLSAKIEKVASFIMKVADSTEEETQNIEKVFATLANQVRRSGVEAIDGVGVSVIAAQPGLYRSRFVIHKKGPDTGYLWQFFGAAPHPLSGAELLPADTAWVMFGDLDVNAIWGTLRSSAEQANIGPLVQALQGVSDQVLQITGRSLEDQLASTAGEIGVALTLDAGKPFTLSLEGMEVPDVPEPGLLIAIKVKDDILYDWIVAQLAGNPQATSGEAEGARWHSLPRMEQAPVPLQPTVARVGEYLILASQEALVGRVARVLQGSEPGLDEAAEWKQLSTSLPTEGNSFCFVSSRFGDTIQRIQQSMLEKEMAKQGEAAVDLSAIQDFFGLSLNAAVYSVSRCDDFGWQWVSHSTQDPMGAGIRAALIAPVGLLAAVMIPAFVSARGQAEDVACMSKLRQISMALQMYALEHDGIFPTEPGTELEGLLGNVPAMFVCPGAKPADDLTWEAASASPGFYEFLTPGLNTATAEAQTVVLRCPLHGTEALADSTVAAPGP